MMKPALRNEKPAMFDENMAGETFRRVMFVMSLNN